MAGAGIVLGIAATLVAGRWIRTQLVGVSPTDPVTLCVSAAVLLVVTVIACALPAWRASRVDPASTLTAD